MFDVDGTMAETEEFHRRAFNEAFSYFDLPWNWDVATYGRLLRIAGGRERIRYFWKLLPEDRFDLSDSHINELHRFKTRRYAELVDTGACGLRPGVADLIHRARDGRLWLAIVTTTSRDHIGALLSGNLGPESEFRRDRFRGRRAQQKAGAGCLSRGSRRSRSTCRVLPGHRGLSQRSGCSGLRRCPGPDYAQPVLSRRGFHGRSHRH